MYDGPMNATITVKYGASEVTFELDGTELSQDSLGGTYLTTASKDFIAERVQHALRSLTA